jgi:glycosyltransferase involved in cell wall biosynthesis
MDKIRILAIPPDVHGVGKFRITGPYTHLQENYNEEFHVDIKREIPNIDSEFDNYDIIILHSFIHVTETPEKNIDRINWLKKQGKIVIVDIDDYWLPDQSHPMYRGFIENKVPQRKLELIKSATYVTTTTPIFQKTIKSTTGKDNVLIFPNAIDEKEHQFISTPTPSEKVRFGYLAGSSHENDVKLMRESINVILSSYKDKIQFVLCGFDLRGKITDINKQTGERKQRDIKPEESTWYQYEKVFTNDYRSLDEEYVKYLKMFKEIPFNDLNKPYRRIWTRDINRYALNYNQFDVSLAPLVDSKFNDKKSQLKVVEAGFHKKPIIASESGPYTLDLINVYDKGGTINPKGNALLVPHAKDHKEWAKHMKRLIENPNLREDLGEKLHEMVLRKYSLNVVNKDRTEFLKSIMNKS